MVCLFLFLFGSIGENTEIYFVETLLQNYSQIVNNPQFRETQILFYQGNYRNAFELLAETIRQNPELEVSLVAGMLVLRQQLPPYQTSDFGEEKPLDIYFDVAGSVVESVSVEAKKLLLSDLAEVALIQGKVREAYSYMDELVNEIGTNQSEEYALAMLQYANLALEDGNEQKAMEVLEEVRRNRDYYSEDLQDKISFQLFNLYSRLNRYDHALKLGKELLDRFEEAMLGDFSNVYDFVSLLKNLADIYFHRGEYKDALKFYNRIKELLAQYPPPAGDIRSVLFQQLYNDVKEMISIIEGGGDQGRVEIISNKSPKNSEERSKTRTQIEGTEFIRQNIGVSPEVFNKVPPKDWEKQEKEGWGILMLVVPVGGILLITTVVKWKIKRRGKLEN